MAAESGDARARRFRELAQERAEEAEKYRRLAEAVEKGNVGERAVAERLELLDNAGWHVLNDRYKPGSTANLDHVVVGPPGVFLLDAKNWAANPLRADERGIAVRGYRRDDELAATVDSAVLLAPIAERACAGTSVTPALVFTQDMQLSRPLLHQGLWLLQLDHMLEWLTSQQPRLDRSSVQRLASTLDAALPPRTESPRPLTVDAVLRPRRASTARRPAAAPNPRRVPPPPSRATRRAAARAARRRAEAKEALVKLATLVLFVFVIVPWMLSRSTSMLPEPGPTQSVVPVSTVAPSTR